MADFMSFTLAQFQALPAKMRGESSKPSADAVSREVEDLHEPIMKWCADNRVPYIHARTDQPSGIGRGAPDFTIFYRQKVLLIECKSRQGKVKPEQFAWHLLADRQGFCVHVVRSMEEFQALL